MTRLSRVAAALFALWVSAVLGDPGVLHTCAMHGAAHHGGAVTHVTAPAHGMHGAHASAGAGMEKAGGERHDAPATCTCVGQCCTTAVTTLPSSPTLSLAAIVAAPHREAPPVVDLVVGAPAGLRLPFQTAPPTA